MSAHVLLNVLKELGKVISLFHNEFNVSNKIGARMLDSIHHMTLYYLKNRNFGVKTPSFCHLLRNVVT